MAVTRIIRADPALPSDLFQGHARQRSDEDLMPIATRELYRSANGDRWLLARDNGRVFVRHEANFASGGNVTDSEIGDFLCRGGLGPEKQELLRLVGTLVEDRSTSEGKAGDPE